MIFVRYYIKRYNLKIKKVWKVKIRAELKFTVFRWKCDTWVSLENEKFFSVLFPVEHSMKISIYLIFAKVSFE